MVEGYLSGLKEVIQNMRIVADENIPLVEEFFAELGPIQRIPGRDMNRAQLQGAELLLVRSVTQVDQQLLAGSGVRFVASATIGTDHIDQAYLSQQGIGFANAPGCNADSVVDYVLSALLNLCQEQDQYLLDRTVGIIGVGNVGSRLQQRLQALGCRVLLNDPPRADQEGNSEFTPLPQLLAEADIFCLHTPLTRSGNHPSYHLLNTETLATLKPGAWLINAGRGGAIDNQALSALLEQRSDLTVVLDVWENEPDINLRLAQQVHWGTPHIAGYSIEGRSRGTEMIYQAACRFLAVPMCQSLTGLLAPGAQAQGGAENLALINQVYDLRQDHHRLQQMLADAKGDRSAVRFGFDQLRKQYPARREFSSLDLSGVELSSERKQALIALGFHCKS
ncbi:MAG: 4-phosphoerythronate dehydrogenase PdxB [Motiliproteus sp.]|nr:4-phosphoerythronate dehydrogenase PdxB [Motiliproteus sp.]MCW9053022.1 4-phosphoerythronate dehydrogenase PdxB [Motiliproteus sp.]